jgi:lipoate-protein ligase A
MRFLVAPDLTLPEQLALDEALLEAREAGVVRSAAVPAAGSCGVSPRDSKYRAGTPGEPAGEDACATPNSEVIGLTSDSTGEGEDILRVWESPSHGVVVGMANVVESEVDVAACREAGVPILRRVSGGGTVLQGPGCLNYSVILGIEPGGPLDSVTDANNFVMKRIRDALNPIVEGGVVIAGHTDLAIDGRKFSGNAQKRKRRALLFHGTLLLDFDLGRIGRLLRAPSKQPDYRADRDHGAFVRNVGLSKDTVIQALRKEWGGVEEERGFPQEEVARLVEEKYSKEEWNLRR